MSHRKPSTERLLLLASTALTMLAFAAPTTAPAVTLTEEGKPLSEGAQVTGTSVNMLLTSEVGTTACATVKEHFEVLTNGLEHVVLKPLGEISFEHCTKSLSNVIFSEAEITENLTLDEWGTGEAKAEFQWSINAFLTCHFTGSLHTQGRDEPEADVLYSASTFAGTGAFCPTKSAVFHATFRLETANGTPLDLNFEETE